MDGLEGWMLLECSLAKPEGGLSDTSFLFLMARSLRRFVWTQTSDWISSGQRGDAKVRQGPINTTKFRAHAQPFPQAALGHLETGPAVAPLLSPKHSMSSVIFFLKEKAAFRISLSGPHL